MKNICADSFMRPLCAHVHDSAIGPSCAHTCFICPVAPLRTKELLVHVYMYTLRRDRTANGRCRKAHVHLLCSSMRSVTCFVCFGVGRMPLLPPYTHTEHIRYVETSVCFGSFLGRRRSSAPPCRSLVGTGSYALSPVHDACDTFIRTCASWGNTPGPTNTCFQVTLTMDKQEAGEGARPLEPSTQSLQMEGTAHSGTKTYPP